MVNTKRKLWKKILASMLGCAIITLGIYKNEKKKMFSGKYVTGLFFHNPPKSTFENSIKWLVKNNCIFISTEKLLQIIKGKSAIPRRAVWITVDDGWHGNMSGILPVMTKYNIPITFFISTDPVENRGVFWFSLVRKFKNNLPQVYQKNIKKLWLVDEHIRKEIVEKLEAKVSAEIAREAMTVSEVQYLSTIPLVTIGSHTVHHVLTPNCTDRELTSEILDSQLKLEEWTGKKVIFFSYPSGKSDGREKKVFRKSGIKLAATTRKKFITSSDDVYHMPRFCVNDEAYLPERLCQMVGAWGKVMNYFTFLQPKLLLNSAQRNNQGRVNRG